MESEMKTARGIIAAAAIAFAVPAHAASGDPLKVIYVFSGVRDSGTADNTGQATSVQCTSFSGVAETINVIVKDDAGTQRANTLIPIAPAATQVASTHGTPFSEAVLATGSINAGSLAVLATS